MGAFGSYPGADVGEKTFSWFPEVARSRLGDNILNRSVIAGLGMTSLEWKAWEQV